MDSKIFKMYYERVRFYLDRCADYIFEASVPLKAEVAVTDEPVKFADRLSLKYKPITEGTVWGHEWQSAWFKLMVTVPKDFAGRELCLRVNIGGEGLFFDAQGNPDMGITGISAFSNIYFKDRYRLPGTFKGGEKLTFWLEGAANGLFGVNLADPNSRHEESPIGTFNPNVSQLKLCIFDNELWQFHLDLDTLCRKIDILTFEDYRARQTLNFVTKAFDIYNYDRKNAAKARKFLAKTAFAMGAAPSSLTACTVGHAHIDVGWLWPVSESTRKAARTYSSQLKLMERYPDYVFGASQAYLYSTIKENYPKLFNRIKQRVKEGRWEIQGGMWVEADCNVPSGESLCRQFLHAKNFFMDEFGFDVKNLWIPDVFGYSAALPQIIKQAGCDYFLTQKLSWSEVNKFPHQTFFWEGIDGTRILTHFPPENTYNSYASPQSRFVAQQSFVEADSLDRFMSLIGIGDGGGGPSEEFIENALRQNNLDACPKNKFERADKFFEAIAKQSQDLKTWKGELYLEMHRGTLTTQARTKRGNRKCEQALTALEILASNLTNEQYPAEMLDSCWKTLLLNQFHDIIPGSSISKVYERTHREHKEILEKTSEQMKLASKVLFKKQNGTALLINTLSVPWTGIVSLPWKGLKETFPSQAEENSISVLVTVPANGCITLHKAKDAKSAITDKSTVLENELIKYKFDNNGQIISAFDKEIQKEILSAPGNVLSLYNDQPRRYEAWDVEIYFKKEFKGILKCKAVSPVTKGDACSSITFDFATDKSKLSQKVILRNDSKRLDFICNADWHEHRTMLRTSFPTTIQTNYATFDIQYGFLRRSTTENTSWDEACFESVGQRYADLSSNDYGISLLNDCKYGYHVKGNTIDLNLLRSPKHPDFTADMGKHTFTYSLFPHAGNHIAGNVIQEAAQLNREPWLEMNLADNNFKPFCNISSTDGVSLEVLKKAEKSGERIIRLVETRGENSTATLVFNGTCKSVSTTNIMEWTHGEKLTIKNHSVQLSFKPFEIKTLRIN